MGAIIYKDKVYGVGGSIIEGYYKVADGKFYEESTYETEIPGAEDLLYIDLSTKMQFIFDGTNFVNITEDAKPTVTEASSRTNIASGDTLKTIIGKIKKFFADLKTVAFTGAYSDLSGTPSIPTITDTYSGTSSDGMSGKAVKSAIDALDGTVSGSAGAGKTLTAFSQTDGKVTATFGDISITKSQVSNMPTKLSDFTNDLTLLKAVDFSDGTAYVPQTEHLSAMIACVRENNANVGLGSNTYGGNILAINWGNGNWKYNSELFMGCGDKPVMYFRGKNTSQTDAYCDWRQIVQGHKDVQKYYDKQTVDLSSLDVNTFYPVTGTPLNYFYVGYVHMTVFVALNSGTVPSWSTHTSGFSVFIDILNEAQGWGATVGTGICLANQFSWCAASPCGYSQMGNSSTPVFWCRGGGKYFIYSDHPMTWTIRTSTYTASGQSVAPRSTNPGVSFFTTPNIVANITGSSATATKATQDGDGNTISSTYVKKSITTLASNKGSSAGDSFTVAAITNYPFIKFIMCKDMMPYYCLDEVTMPSNKISTLYGTNNKIFLRSKENTSMYATISFSSATAVKVTLYSATSDIKVFIYGIG